MGMETSYLESYFGYRIAQWIQRCRRRVVKSCRVLCRSSINQRPINAAKAPIVISSPDVFSMDLSSAMSSIQRVHITFHEQSLCRVMAEFMWQAEPPPLI